MGELSLTKPFIGCYLGSEFSELNRPLIDNETRNFSILPKKRSRDRQRKSATKLQSTTAHVDRKHPNTTWRTRGYNEIFENEKIEKILWLEIFLKNSKWFGNLKLLVRLILISEWIIESIEIQNFRIFFKDFEFLENFTAIFFVLTWT